MNDGGTATDGKLVRVGVADGAVSGNGATLATSGLGSCVAIALYDTNGSGVGGLLHAMLPAAPESTDTYDNPTKYVDTGLAHLLDEIETNGGDRHQVVAKFAGGSAMLDIGTGGGIGAKNVAAAERALEDYGIDVDGSDTGGDSGRSVRFHPNSGEYIVERVDSDTLTL